MNMKIHKYADIFPAMSPEEYAGLLVGMEKNGYLAEDPIIVLNGEILDGRNRYKAACDLGIKPITKEYSGTSPLDFVFARNFDRRHLTTGQKVVAGMEIKKIEAEAAKRRQAASGVERQKQARNSHNKNKEQLPPILGEAAPQEKQGEASKIAAKRVGVSHSSISEGEKIEAKAPEVVQLMKAGLVNPSIAKKIANLPDEIRPSVIEKIVSGTDGTKAIQEAHRSEQKIKNQETSRKNMALPEKKYSLILADPPWRYEHSKTMSRDIENQYPTMALDEICDLPVQNLAADDCVLFLWATSPKLAESIRVLESWGFEYRTCAVWDKQKIGLGYYFRQQHEILLVGIKGSPGTPDPASRPSSIYSEARGKHSAKPNYYRDVIEKMYPDHNKIELFCRDKRDGWDAWGNQTDE